MTYLPVWADILLVRGKGMMGREAMELAKQNFLEAHNYELLNANEYAQVYCNADKTAAAFFVGSSSKPKKHYRFRCEADLYAYTNKFLDDIKKSKEEAIKEREKDNLAKKEEFADVNIGDILVENYGYSMVLSDFYVVIKKTKCTITVVRLAERIVSGDTCVGEHIPIKGELRGRPETYRNLYFGRGHVEKWNGKPVAFDHMD